LLDAQFELKIGDMGFATRTEGHDKSGILKDKVGTDGYMAPEMYLLKYNGVKVDLFAAGVVLFILLAGHPPFIKTTATDPYYRLFRLKKYETYWQ